MEAHCDVERRGQIEVKLKVVNQKEMKQSKQIRRYSGTSRRCGLCEASGVFCQTKRWDK